jgi:hypothetical protein
MVPTMSFAMTIAMSGRVSIAHRVSDPSGGSTDDGRSGELSIKLAGEILNGNQISVTKPADNLHRAADKLQRISVGRDGLREKPVYAALPR